MTPITPSQSLTGQFLTNPASTEQSPKTGPLFSDTLKAQGAEQAAETPSLQNLDVQADITEQFDTFLNLLTAQIKNQDPLAPLDSTQFVDQLATFSGLELQASANQTLEDIARMLQIGLSS